jgi:hypothetical protein
MEWVLIRLTWHIVTSRMNVECKAATELDWMRNRYVQALDLSPGFSDLDIFKKHIIKGERVIKEEI